MPETVMDSLPGFIVIVLQSGVCANNEIESTQSTNVKSKDFIQGFFRKCPVEYKKQDQSKFKSSLQAANFDIHQ